MALQVKKIYRQDAKDSLFFFSASLHFGVEWHRMHKAAKTSTMGEGDSLWHGYVPLRSE